MSVFDQHANLALSTVTVAPVPAGAGLVFTVADGSVFPATPFNATVWPADVCALDTNAEIVRVTGNAAGVLTVLRAQEGTSAIAIAAGYQIANSATVLTFTEIEDAINQIETDAVFDGDAAGGVLSGTYPNPGFAVDMATQAELDASILGAVILLPTTDGRNVIQPSAATVIPLTLKGFAAQSDDLLQVQDSTGAVLSRVNETGWLGIGVDPTVPLEIFKAVTGNPAANDEGTALRSVVDFTSPVGVAPASTVSVANWLDARFVAVLESAQAQDHLYALFANAKMDVSGSGSTGDAVGVISAGFRNQSTAANVYPIDFLQTIVSTIEHRAPLTVPYATVAQFATYILGGSAGTVTNVHDIESGYGTLSNPVTVAKWYNLDVTPPSTGHVSALVSEYAGLHVGTYSAGTGQFTNYYGALLENPNVTIAGTKYAFVSRGGQSLLTAGAATEKPLVVKGAAAQSANLQEWQDSAAATWLRITSAGVFAFGSSGDTNLYRSAADVLKTDDSLAVGGSYTVDPSGFWDGAEISVPATPAENHGRLFWRDSGGGLTQLVAVFPSGNTLVVAEDF